MLTEQFSLDQADSIGYSRLETLQIGKGGE